MKKIQVDLKSIPYSYRTYCEVHYESKEKNEQGCFRIKGSRFSLNGVPLLFGEAAIGLTRNSSFTKVREIVHTTSGEESICPLCRSANRLYNHQGGYQPSVCLFAMQEEVYEAILKELEQTTRDYAVEFTENIHLLQPVCEKVELGRDKYGDAAYHAHFIFGIQIGDVVLREKSKVSFRTSEYAGEDEVWSFEGFSLHFRKIPYTINLQIEETFQTLLKKEVLSKLQQEYILPEEVKRLKNVRYEIVDMKRNVPLGRFLIWFKLNDIEETLLASFTIDAGDENDIIIYYDDGSPYEEDNFNEYTYETFDASPCVCLDTHLTHCFKEELCKRNEFRLNMVYTQIKSTDFYDEVKKHL